MSADLTPEEREQVFAAARQTLPPGWDKGDAHQDTLTAAVERILAARAQAAPLTAEAIAGLLAEHRLHASMNICTGCDWRAELYKGRPLRDQHDAHQAEVIASAQATDATRADEHGPDWSDRPEGAEDSCKCGFNGTAAECVASRAATRADTASEALAQAAVVAHKGPNDTDAAIMRLTARDLRGGYDAGGSNRRAAVARVLDVVADLIEPRAALGGDPDHSHGRRG